MKPGKDILPSQLLNAAHFHFFTNHLDDMFNERLIFISDQNELVFHILLTVGRH